MNILKKILKILAWILVGLMLIVMLVVLGIQTKPVKRIIVQTAQNQVNKILKAQLNVESIDGNFFTKLGLNNVFLQYNNDTIGFIPNLDLKYKLLPLLKGTILVKSVELDDPIFYLTQYADSTWNFQNIVKPSEKKDTVSTPFTMKLAIENVKINHGKIFVNAIDTLIPRRVDDLNTDLSFHFSSNEQEIDLRELRLVASKPDLKLKNLTFYAKRDTASIRLKDFNLQTSFNKITADARYQTKNWDKSFANIETEPIDVDEFKFLIPSLKIPAKPTLKFAATLDKSVSTIHLNVKEKQQAIDLNILSDNLVDFLTKKDSKPLEFKLNGNFDKLNVKDWIDDPAMDYKLTGTLVAEGKGIDYRKMEAKVKGDFKDMTLQKRKVSRLNLDLNYKAGDLSGVVNGTGDFGKVYLTPQVHNLWSKSPSYTALVRTHQLDLSKLALNNEMKSDITIHANIKGSGLDPKTMVAALNAKLTDSRMYGYSVGLADMNFNLNKGNLSGILNGSGNFGKVSITPEIRQLFSKSPGYTAHIVTENLNPAILLKNDSLPGNLNLVLDVSGKGFDPKKMNVTASLNASPSTFNGININELASKVDFADNNLILHSLLLNTQSISLTAEGNYSLVANSDIQLNADIRDASEIAAFLKMDSLDFSGKLDAALTGKVDSLRANLNFNIDSLFFKNNSVQSIKGKVDGLLAKNDTIIHADIAAGELVLGGFAIDSVQLHADSDIRSTALTLKADGDELKTDLAGNVLLGENTVVRLDDFMLDYKGSDWRLVESPALFTIRKTEYEIDNFKLISGNENVADSIQIILANGTVSRVGEQSLDVKLFNIDVPTALNLFTENDMIEGKLDLNLYLRGTSEQPLLEGGFNVDKASVNGYKFNEVAGTINYLDKRLEVDAGVIPKDSGMLELTGFVPFNIRLDSMKVAPPSGNDSIKLQVNAEKLPLKIAQAFVPIDKVDGYLQSNIMIDGTMNNPNPIGDLHIVGGKAAMKKYGIDYRSILASVRFEKETVTVDTFFIQNKTGTMLAKGDIGFNSHFYKGDIQNSEIDIAFKNFRPFDHRYYSMELSGNASLHGKKDSVYFDGDLNVLEALFYLPAVMNIIGSGSAPTDIHVPALISELERNGLMHDSVHYYFREVEANESKTSFNYFDNLQGKVKVYIPRNAWIKNEQMRFEISGDVEVIKHRSFMEIFGTVDVIRGQYELLGKTFVVDDGTITFQGGKDLNPRLDITATYNVRNRNRSDNNLKINVTGELKEPKISFEMGGEQMTEGDALSYILFGTNMDALASGQEAALNSGTAGSIATGAAASILSSELTKILGKTLNVDYIEMRAGSSFENATFVVGKYLTNRLFMSYARRFGDFKDEQVAEYEVKLEYELFRFLFLQLASSPINNGVDVIFKIDSKTKFKE